MNISLFSLMMSVLFSTVFILAIHVLRNRPFFLKSFGVHTLLILYGLCLFRMIFVIELPFTVPIGLRGAFSHTYAQVRQFRVPVGGSNVAFLDIVFDVWIVVAAAIFARFVWREFMVRKHLSPYRNNMSYAAERALAKARKVLSGKTVVNVCVCSQIDTPIGLGLFKRWIYLPDEEYTAEELFYIMAHEYTHFCNRDGVVKFLTLLLCCIFWWNPAVYLLRKDVDQILEIKCDVNVTQDFSKKERLEYLLTIVRTLKGEPQPKSGSSSWMATGLVSRTEHDDIRERFELITKATKRFGIRYQTAFVGLAFLVTVFSYAFVLQSAFDPPVDEIYTDSSVQELTSDNSHILKHKDGSYSLVLQDGYVITKINKETLEALIEEGLEIRKE